MVADLLGSLQIFLDVMQMWCLCELSKKLFVALGHRKKKEEKKASAAGEFSRLFPKPDVVNYGKWQACTTECSNLNSVRGGATNNFHQIPEATHTLDICNQLTRQSLSAGCEEKLTSGNDLDVEKRPSSLIH